LKNSII